MPDIPAEISQTDPPARDCCDRTPSPEMLHAFEQFNRGEFWHQHETLELVWRAETDTSIRNFYKGVLQVGVGFHHLRKGNYNGVVKVLGRGITYLKPYAPACYGVDVARLIEQASVIYWRVSEAGKEEIEGLRDVALPQVHLVAQRPAKEARMEYQLTQATPVADVRKMTFEEYLALEDAAPTEWVNGEVLVHMPNSVKHQQVINFLDRLLGMFVELLGLGIVLTDRIAVRLAPDVVREPDLFFLANAHSERLKPTFLEGAPDFIVEIISEDSVARDRADKFYEYQDGGVREYLIIDPRPGKQRVDYYALNEQGRYDAILADEQGRYHSNVIKGFWFRADWLLQENQPDPLRTLLQIAPDAVKKTVQDSSQEG